MRKRSPAFLLGLCMTLMPPVQASAADPSDSARVGDMHFGNALDLRGWAANLNLPNDDGMSSPNVPA